MFYPKKINITPRMVKIAIEYARDKENCKNSHRGDQGQFVGSLGEVVFEELLKSATFEYEACLNETKYDYKVLGLKFEVKTKERSVRVRPSYECTVPASLCTHQKPDFFYFISLYRTPGAEKSSQYRFQFAEMLGGMESGEFNSKSVFIKKNDMNQRNGMVPFRDIRNVYIKDLVSNEEIFKKLRSTQDQLFNSRSSV